MQLDQVSLRYSVESNYQQCIDFMLECIDLIDFEPPEVAKEAVKKAKKYWSDELSVDELVNIRVSCWDYLDDNDLTLVFTGKDACIVKVVICVLYDEPASEDINEILSWFIQMMRELGDFEQEIEAIMRKNFPINCNVNRKGY
jgi:hypothetical protein